MRRLFTLCIAVLSTATLWVQSPEQISYQIVIRDAEGKLVANRAVGLKISVLKGAASGSAEYAETHTPTTNINGLVSLAFGNGTVLTGAFATIDWADGPYFIKTEADPDGGTTYTITGTTQLMSVPYALHAKTAESLTETPTLTDLVALGNTVNEQLKEVSDPTDVQDAATKAYVDRLETLIDALEARISDLEPKVGDFREGGIVFWVDPNNNTKGLVCAVEDQGKGSPWGCYDASLIDGAYGVAISTGAQNTLNILAGCSETGIAAQLCVNLDLNGYDDWFYRPRMS